MKLDPSLESTVQASMPGRETRERVSPRPNGGSTETLYAITVMFELVEGAFETFHRLVGENARESIASEAGCLRFDVLTPAERAGEVFLYEIYTDREAFDIHLASAHFRYFDATTRDLVRRKTVFAYSVQENAKAVL